MRRKQDKRKEKENKSTEARAGRAEIFLPYSFSSGPRIENAVSESCGSVQPWI